MSGRRVRGLLILAALVWIGWLIYEKRPTVSGIVDDLTRPLLGSRAAVKESEHKRVVGEASQVITLDQEKPVGAIHEGMSESEVRHLLGDPGEIETVLEDRGPRVRWVYRNLNRVVVFDERRRVVSIAIL
ncbi:MAG TPA: hypothetical protein VGB47_04490 [Thermoanaerobaculia bacterium]|jgi:hypothetical protein